FRATTIDFAGQSFEGRQGLELQGDWQRERHDVAAGALYVPAAQPLSRVVLALLEPRAPDSLVAWGGFNNAFERKEYMEDYVTEQVAREMLRDPAVRDVFERRLAEDEAFAADPADRKSTRLNYSHVKS